MDRLISYALRSLARHISVNVSGINAAYVVTPDFDWDKKPPSSNPGDATVPRTLPYAGVVLINDNNPPFTVGNILYEPTIQVNIEMCGTGFTEMVDITGDMKQSLRAAVNPITSGVGITLYDFATVSGLFYANAGTLQLEIGQTEYFGPDTPAQQGNRKYLSITPVILSAFKDNTATLLESKGRVGLADS